RCHRKGRANRTARAARSRHPLRPVHIRISVHSEAAPPREKDHPLPLQSAGKRCYLKWSPSHEEGTSMRVRRVVTGHNDQGEAVFVDDGYVEPTTVALSTTEYHELWRADSAPQFPDLG